MHTHTHRGRNGEDLNIQIKNRGGAERHLGEQLHCKYQPSVRFDVEHWRERGRSIRILRREGGESRRGERGRTADNKKGRDNEWQKERNDNREKGGGIKSVNEIKRGERITGGEISGRENNREQRGRHNK